MKKVFKICLMVLFLTPVATYARDYSHHHDHGHNDWRFGRGVNSWHRNYFIPYQARDHYHGHRYVNPALRYFRAPPRCDYDLQKRRYRQGGEYYLRYNSYRPSYNDLHGADGLQQRKSYIYIVNGDKDGDEHEYHRHNNNRDNND